MANGVASSSRQRRGQPRRGMAARQLVQSGGAGAHGSTAQSRVRAARGEQQHGGGDGATNKRGNSWNVMEREKHEHQCIS